MPKVNRTKLFAIVTLRGALIAHDARAPIFWRRSVAVRMRDVWGWSKDNSRIVAVFVDEWGAQ